MTGFDAINRVMLEGAVAERCEVKFVKNKLTGCLSNEFGRDFTSIPISYLTATDWCIVVPKHIPPITDLSISQAIRMLMDDKRVHHIQFGNSGLYVVIGEHQLVVFESNNQEVPFSVNMLCDDRWQVHYKQL